MVPLRQILCKISTIWCKNSTKILQGWNFFTPKFHLGGIFASIQHTPGGHTFSFFQLRFHYSVGHRLRKHLILLGSKEHLVLVSALVYSIAATFAIVVSIVLSKIDYLVIVVIADCCLFRDVHWCKPVLLPLVSSSLLGQSLA